MAFPNPDGFFPNGIQFYAVISILFGLFVTVFWMVVGWRAMRAHERISAALARDLEQREIAARVSQRNERRNAD